MKYKIDILGHVDLTMSSGEFDVSKKAELLDRIIAVSTDNQFGGLNAFAVSVNLLEGIVGTDIMDVPMIGYLTENMLDKFMDGDLLEDIGKFVPDFIEKITGLDQILQDNSDPSGYLGQNFDLKEFLLGDLDMIRQVEYGLLPADQQILEQQIDLASELFGEEAANRLYNDPDTTDQNFFERAFNLLGDAIYGTPLDQYLKDVKDVVSEEEYNKIKERVDSEPNLFDKLKELVKSGYEGIASPVGEALEAVGFTQQKYFN